MAGLNWAFSPANRASKASYWIDLAPKGNIFSIQQGFQPGIHPPCWAAFAMALGTALNLQFNTISIQQGFQPGILRLEGIVLDSPRPEGANHFTPMASPWV